MSVEISIGLFGIAFALMSISIMLTLKAINDSIRELNDTLSQFLTKEERTDE